MVLPGDRHHYLRSLGGAWMLQGLVGHQQTIASKVPKVPSNECQRQVASYLATHKTTEVNGEMVKKWGCYKIN